MGDQWVPQMWAAAAPLLPVATFAGAPPQIPGGADYVKLEKPDAPGEYGTGDGSYDAGGGHMPYPHADPTQAFFAPMYGAQAVLAPPVCSEQLANQKEAIYAHPFFPLLTCLFEKCELATCTPRDSSRDGGGGGCGINDVVSAESFKEDLAEFTRKLDGNKPYYAPNPELDSLMLQAITMLRFHLLELEKVHELCDNFCQRYVSCLKNKMPLDVGEDRASSSGNAPSPVPSSTASPNMNAPMNFAHYPPPQLAPPFEPQSVPLPESTSAMPQHSLESLQPSSSAYSQLTPLGVMATSSSASGHPLVLDGSVVAAATGHTSTTSSAAGPVPTPGSHGTSSSPATSSTGGLRNGGTPSMYECMNPNPASIESAETGDESSSVCGSNDDGRESVTSEGCSQNGKGHGGGSRKVPKVFSKEAITKFRAWLFQNLTHPYPSEEQKKQLANDTGLTILQVNNWFINARRRIVQPMIDQSNRAGRGGAMCGGGISRSRRRDRDGDSDGGTPEAVGATAMNGGDSTPSIVASSYSPDPSAIVPQMTMPYMPNGMMPTFYPSFNPGAMAPGFLMPGMSMFSGPPWGMDPLSHNGD